MKIAIATDAWRPQVNGVVTTLEHTARELGRRRHSVRILCPDRSRMSFPCPSYPEIRLSVGIRGPIRRELDEYAPDCIHIATEGPVGIATRRYCLSNGIPFTTAYHTRFPEYIGHRLPWPSEPLARRYLRWFHGPSHSVMVSTPTLQREMARLGIHQTSLWPRGVNTSLFRPRGADAIKTRGPAWMYVGRVSIEKGLDDFLALELPGTKYVIGDGPDLERLRQRYTDVMFLGYRFGEELAMLLSAADCFVFPSRTDTFGIVMLEAMACGVPVAAYAVPGPRDVVTHGVTGMLDEDLRIACQGAVTLDRKRCREHAKRWSWGAATDAFENNLVVDESKRLAEARIKSAA